MAINFGGGVASAVVVAATSIGGGTASGILWNNAGVLAAGPTLMAADGTITMAAGVKLRSTASNNLILSGSGSNDWFVTTGANLVGNNNNAISTGAPSGGTLALWKLGSRVAAVSALDTTQYLQVEVAGTPYKLALIS